jgi:hypothetical protein
MTLERLETLFVCSNQEHLLKIGIFESERGVHPAPDTNLNFQVRDTVLL